MHVGYYFECQLQLECEIFRDYAKNGGNEISSIPQDVFENSNPADNMDCDRAVFIKLRTTHPQNVIQNSHPADNLPRGQVQGPRDRAILIIGLIDYLSAGCR